MINRRQIISLGLVSFVAMQLSTKANAHHTAKYKNFKVKKKYLPQTVQYTGYRPGTIVVDTKNHFLYLVQSWGKARRYGIGVGKAGLAFKGNAKIKRKAEWPSWTPTANMIKREPQKYKRFANGVPGGPNNPLGARALYLYKGNRDTYYRIHGTTQPDSIGRSVSNGCIRMINDHVIDLYDRVSIGATVVVL